MKVKFVRGKTEFHTKPKNKEELTQAVNMYLGMLKQGDKIIIRG